MKRAALVFLMSLLLLSPLWLARPLHSATVTQLTGTITDAQGNPLNGYVLSQLPVPAQYTAGNIAVTTTAIRCNVVNGALQTCPPLYDVAALQPANLWYTINAYNTAGQFVMGGNYSVTGGTFNLGAATPTSITTNNVSYLTPVSLSANNTFTGNNSFTNPISVSALGVAPFNILSNTLVANLNAPYWDNILMTNTPVAGQVPTALTTSTAAWEFPNATFGNGYIDLQEIVTPANPIGGYERIYASSAQHQALCINSSGGACSYTPTLSTTTVAGNTAISSGSDTSVANLTFTFPTIGNTYRVDFKYSLYVTFSASEVAVACWVYDGTNTAAYGQTSASNGSAGGKTSLNVDLLSTNTYAAGTGSTTFNLYCRDTAGNATIQGAPTVSPSTHGVAVNSTFQAVPVQMN